MRRVPRFAVVFVVSCFASAAVAEPFVAPRGPGGKPDLNGTWRAFARANDGLEAHAARPAYALQEGPHGLLPAKEVLRRDPAVAVDAEVVVGAVEVSSLLLSSV